ncbi:D-alanyl-D-alanine carboxypeptidase DacB [Lachnospiraceae bacterium]|nr:D-alanyl-D-alanine carboxypeptidase DacB [Lachnospiraceae bacterium]
MKIYWNRNIRKIWTRTAAFCGIGMLVLGILAQPVQAKRKKSAQYWPSGPEIVSSAGIIMDAETGTILYEKNIHDVHYPASITKILTTLLAIENSKMDEIVTFSKDSVYKTEGSGIARDVGEQMTMEQCLYGIMLSSANECAYAVGEHVGGDIGSFVQMMNDRAAKLGCQNTHFNNSNGLPDEQHYTSAYDMALIAREAYQNETFRIICSAKTYTIPFTNKHTDEETYLQNHHQMLYPYRTRKYLYDYCLGGKTGYTVAAGNTLVTYAEKDGMTLICVVMNAPSGHYEDTRALFDFCFDNFKVMNVRENETSYTQQDAERKGVLGSYEPFVALDASSHVILPITAEFTDADSEIVYDKKDENILGSIRYTYADRLVGTADITASHASADTFEFREEEDTEPAADAASDQENTETKKAGVFRIDIKLAAVVLAGLLLLAVLIFLGWKFIDNFYNIKRKLHLGEREKSPYKTIKQNRMYRKRRRKWF